MPDPSIRSLINDIELVEHAQQIARKKDRTLRYVKEDGRTDGSVYEDVSTGDRQSVPNKFIKAIGLESAFELMSVDEKDLIPHSK